MIKLFLNLFLLIAMTQAQWDDLYESRDLNEFLKAEKRVYFFERMEKACKLEQKNQWFPENCLKMWNQTLLNFRDKKSRKNYKNLEKMCKTRAQEIVEIEHLRSLLELLLPVRCRQALEKRSKDLEYMEIRSFESDFE